MADRYRLCLCCCLLFAFSIICSARNTILPSEEEIAVVAMEMEGRSLNVNVNDYSEATANRGHDPKNRVSGGSGGRKSREIP